MSRTFAQRAGDFLSNPSVPRSCCIQIARLTLAKPLEKRDSLSFFITLQANSRRPQARGDEICISSLEKEFAQNMSFEYQHFTKNRSNILYISLQKKRRYRTAAVPGYKTLARGQINLDDIIQLPPSKSFPIKLFKSDSISRDMKHEIGELEISEVSSIPTEDDHGNFPQSDSSDDEETNPNERKMKNSFSMASRVKSAVLSKLLERVIKKNPHINPEDIDMDQVETMDLSELQLYDDLDDLGVSSDEEEIFNVDSVSIASTPRPSLQPYFDSASQCSLQARNSIGAYSSGRRSNSNKSTMPKVDEERRTKSESSTTQDDNQDKISEKDQKRPQRTRRSITSSQNPEKLKKIKEDLNEAVENAKPMLVVVQSQATESLIDKLSTINSSFIIIDVAPEQLQLLLETFLQVILEADPDNLPDDPLKFCLHGSSVDINFAVKFYIEKLSKKINENFMNYFFIPLDEMGKSQLCKKIGETCGTYKRLFLESEFESNDLNRISEKLSSIQLDANHVARLPVSEAMLSLSDVESDGHQVVPFCVELAVLETEDDSESDDGRFTMSPTSSPYVSNGPGLGQPSEKLNVVVEYWLSDDEKQTKHSIKETLKILEFQPMKSSILMKFISRRRPRPNLPGLKRNNDASVRERREIASRVVFKPREKSVTARVSIDGQEFENISFFQIKPTQNRFIPIAVFTNSQDHSSF